MLDERTNIYEYEQILMGQRDSFQVSFKGTLAENQVEVGNIWRYAITKLLGWTPEQALKNLNNEIVDSLMLNKTFVGLGFDREHSFISDYRFILQHAFPDEIRYDMYTETIAEYERIAKLGIWKNDKNNYKFPKSFFVDENGADRAKILFRYALDTYMGDYTIEEKYKFFADRIKATKWINSRKLGKPYRVMYSTPLDFLHDALPFKDKDMFLYNSLKLKAECDAIEMGDIQENETLADEEE